MRKRWIVLVLVLLVAGIGAYAGGRAFYSTHQGGCGNKQAFGVLHSYLGLSEAQKSELTAIDADFAKKRPLLREQVWQARDKLTAVLRDPKSSRKDALSAAEELGRAQNAMQVNTVEYVYELRTHLNDQQRAKLADVLSKGMCSAIEGKSGMGMGRCGGCDAPQSK